MRIGPKLLLGFIPLAILTAMVAEVLYINSKWIAESSQIVKEVYQNYGNIVEMRQHEKNYLFYREKFYLYSMKDISMRLDEFFSQRERMGSGDDLAKAFASTRETLSRYRGLIEQLLVAGEGPQAEKKISEMATVGYQLERSGEQMIHISWIPMQMGTRKARTYSIVFAIQAALIGVVLAFYLSRLLVKPIRQLVRGTKKLAEGDFSQRVQLR